MCGICFVLEKKTSPEEKCQLSQTLDSAHFDELLRHRGPDISSHHQFPVSKDFDARLLGYVLRLRGKLTPQPIVDDKGSALLWNGEIFGGIQVGKEENDTCVLFEALNCCHTESEIIHTIQTVEGPWALIYWQANEKTLWFGRDMFGRRSLLWHLPRAGEKDFVISSVAAGNLTYTEIPAVGVFSLKFETNKQEELCPLSLTLHPWQNCVWPGSSLPVRTTPADTIKELLFTDPSCDITVSIDERNLLTSWIPEMNMTTPCDDQSSSDSSCSPSDSGDLTLMSDGITKNKESDSETSMEQTMIKIMKTDSVLDKLSDDLIQVLGQAVETRTSNLPLETDGSLLRGCDRGNYEDEIIPVETTDEATHTSETWRTSCPSSRPGLPTTGSKVAILFSGGLDSSVLAALADRFVPKDEAIDLLNVAFEQNKKSAQSTGKMKKNKKGKNCTNNLKKQNESNKDKKLNEETLEKMSNNLLDSCNVSSYSDCTTNLGDIFNCDIVQDSTSMTQSDSENNVDSASTSLTGCDTFSGRKYSSKFENGLQSTEPLSYLNRSDSNSNNNSSPNSLYEVPDRLTGRIALSELNPNRKWNFIEINISQKELEKTRKERIKWLIYPLSTVLDDSIGCAVWFAARGVGTLHGHNIRSNSRVLLCGMAADEQFAGYSRHRVTFARSGWKGLVHELREEIWRISARNLGRDDRIITDHGKESRFPFLDEKVTKFVSKIPVHLRADLLLPRGIGEKLLLRLAALKLGLTQTASQPKRAIQFGSKIAKLDNSKEKGSQVCHRLS